LKEHGIPQSQNIEPIGQIVCSDCGKQHDPDSAKLFQLSYGDMGKEWKEVSWEKRGVRQAYGWKPKEMILCSPCAKQFREKKLEDEWREMKLATVFVVLMVLGMMVAVIILVLHLSK
jgi:hypothetical protein